MKVGEDTILYGHQASLLLMNQTYNWPQSDGGSVFTQSGFNLMAITRSSGDSVFYAQSDQWMLLYDFDAEVGDTWLCRVSQFSECPDDSTMVEVIEVGTIDVGGDSRRYLELETISNSDFDMSGMAVEGIGMVESYYSYAIFPGIGILDECGLIVEAEHSTFQCYSDAQIGVYGEGDCGFVSLVEYDSFNISVYPNPVSQNLYIDFRDADLQANVDIKLYDSTGRLMITIDSPEADCTNDIWSFDMSAMTPGSYLLRISSSEGQIGSRMIVKTE